MPPKPKTAPVPVPVKNTTSANLSHLSGPEIERVAAALHSSHLTTLLDRKDEITKLKTDELNSLVKLGDATRAHCGGLDCG
jgi:hypothetical protein